MDKSKALLVIEPNDIEDVFFNDWLSNGYNAEVLFKRVNKPLRAIRRFFMNKDWSISTMWLGSWFNELDKYEVLILHMSRLTRYLPEIISRKYPKLRILCWYRNTIDENNKPIKTNNNKIEYWSFDESDCEKYNLSKNIQYYCTSDIVKEDKTIDLYFIGLEKGRETQINDIKRIADENGLVCDFNVVSNDSEYIPYSTVKKKLNKVKAVLEINKQDQVGFTLRTMESLFYGIKLITNNSYIKKSPIYNTNNVFIIGEDDFSKLREFINSDYDHSVDYLKKQYDLDAWFKNFFI